MLKIGIKIKANDNEVNLDFVDATKKDLQTATEEEKFIAQAIKEIFDESLTDLLQAKINVN